MSEIEQNNLVNMFDWENMHLVVSNAEKVFSEEQVEQMVKIANEQLGKMKELAAADNFGELTVYMDTVSDKWGQVREWVLKKSEASSASSQEEIVLESEGATEEEAPAVTEDNEGEEDVPNFASAANEVGMGNFLPELEEKKQKKGLLETLRSIFRGQKEQN
jgi:nitrate reductase alpha subunit